jgi:hypothetical protein
MPYQKTGVPWSLIYMPNTFTDAGIPEPTEKGLGKICALQPRRMQLKALSRLLEWAPIGLALLPRHL